MRVLACAAIVIGCGPTANPVVCTEPFLPGDLVVTEVFADYQGASDLGKQWFEIYNATDRPVELLGLTITASRSDGSAAHSHHMRELVIAPGQFFTLGDSPPNLVLPYVDYGYGRDLGELSNAAGGKLTLACDDIEIDSATYTAIKPGHSRELSAEQPPDSTFNDDPAHWCQGNDSEFEAGNFGTPGQDSDCVPLIAGQCLDGGTPRDVVVARGGDLVISEVMPSPSKVSDVAGEWFEVTAKADVDLNGIALDRAGDSAKPEVLSSPDCLAITAGNRVVFARSADITANGGLPPVRGTFGFSLVAGSTSSPGDLRLLAGTTVVDAVTWTKSASGKSLQLDPGLIDAIANDAETNFCNAITGYGLGDFGTPGTANARCTMLPPAGMCDDQGTLRTIVKPLPGALVISEIMPNPKLEPAQEWFEITNASTAAFDVNELALDRAGDTRAPDVIHAAACKSIVPQGFALFARSAAPATNGMLPPVDATFGFSMVNAGGDVQVLDGTTVLDAVTWATSTDGVSSQVRPSKLTTTGNDAPGNFCPATAPYGDQTNKGTPKHGNAC